MRSVSHARIDKRIPARGEGYGVGSKRASACFTTAMVQQFVLTSHCKFIASTVIALTRARNPKRAVKFTAEGNGRSRADGREVGEERGRGGERFLEKYREPPSQISREGGRGSISAKIYPTKYLTGEAEGGSRIIENCFATRCESTERY